VPWQEGRQTDAARAAGDVIATAADVADLSRDVGFEPKTPIEAGIPRFIDWYREYYGS
jgi:UDP-glucuronate 4-epimerase